MKQRIIQSFHIKNTTGREKPNYRRAFLTGGTWFFTISLLQRHGNNLLLCEIDLFRDTVRDVREQYPFKMDALVVLIEHFHCVLTLPQNDSDFTAVRRLSCDLVR